MSAGPGLDIDELSFLALEAGHQNRPEQALQYLKEAIARSPQRGVLYYLLGAQHAQLGMFDRAAEELARAVALAPELHTARLQLGMLHLAAGRLDAALATLEALGQLGPESALYHFGEGLRHLAHDRFAECRTAVEHGLALDMESVALRTDMQKLLDRLPAAVPASVTSEAGSVWLAAYRQDEGSH